MESEYYTEEDDGHPCAVCGLPVFILFKRHYAGQRIWLRWVAQELRCRNGCLRRGDQRRLNYISLGHA
jgi:hypothetical protein